MPRSELLDLCKQAVSQGKSLGADLVEAFGQSVDSVSSTIEKHDMQISKSQQERAIGVRAFVGKRVGFASTNRVDRLDEACRDAVALAKISPEDPHNVLPDPSEVSPIADLYDPASADFTAAEAVQKATAILEETERTDGRVIVNDASFDVTIGNTAIANSLGLEAEQRGSLFLYWVFATARDGDRVSSFDFQFGATRQVDEIDVAKPVHRVCDNVLVSLEAEPGESFRGTVLLAPAAVADILVGALLFQLNARNALRGRTRWKDAIGESVAANSFSLVDDGRLAGGVATSAFDREGVPHQRLALIEEGRLASHIHNAYSAHGTGETNTGHAAGGAQSLPGIGPTNLAIAPGAQSSDALISEVDRGLIVQRYSGNVDPISGDFSGAVKAARLIEGGQLGRPVTGTLISGNVFDVLQRISGISKDRERIFGQTLPYVRLEDISVSA